MKTALETALASNISASSITVDGQTVKYRNRTELLSEYKHWSKVAAKESGTKPLAAQIRLGNAF